MNNTAIQISIRFVGLLLLQVLVLNHVDFMGYLNPLLYVMYVVLFPMTGKRWILLVSCFFLGFLIDIFNDSGGIHAAALVTIAFIRPILLKLSFGTSYEFQNIDLKNTEFFRLLTYFGILVFIHHAIVFQLEKFNMEHILTVLKTTLFSGVLTLICMFLYLAFVVPKKR